MIAKIFSRQYKLHYRKTLLLALPVVLGQAGHMVAGIADNMMVGQIGVLPLAASSFANNIVVLFLVFAIGGSLGITPVVSAARGKKSFSKCVGLLKSALGIGLLFGILTVTLAMICGNFLHSFGQQPEVVELAKVYYKLIAWSVLPLALFLAYKQYMEGLGNTQIAMYASLIGNLLNILLNYLLIFGHAGFEPMGLYGAGIATLLSRIFMLGFMVVAVRFSPLINKYKRLAQEQSHRYWAYMKEITSISLPSALQSVLEVGTFVYGALLVGSLGAEELAAHQIVISLASLTYLMATGIGAAATIRVSNYFGKDNIDGIRVSAFAATALVLVFMMICAFVFIIGRQWLPSFYVETSETAVLSLASQLMLVAAVFQLFDGVQVVALGALRGIADVKIPTLIVLAAYWLIAASLSYSAVKLGFGPFGVWVSLCTGLFSAAVMLSIRFAYLTKRMGQESKIKKD